MELWVKYDLFIFFILVVEFELKLGFKKLLSSFSYTVSDIWRVGKQKDEVWGSMRLYLYRLDQPINSTDEDK